MNILSAAEAPRTVEEAHGAFESLVEFSHGHLALYAGITIVLALGLLLAWAAVKCFDLLVTSSVSMIERRRLMAEIAEIDRTGEPR